MHDRLYLATNVRISDAAIQAYKQIGQEPVALSGPWEWMHEGRRLDEIRRDIEEKSD